LFRYTGSSDSRAIQLAFSYLHQIPERRTSLTKRAAFGPDYLIKYRRAEYIFRILVLVGLSRVGTDIIVVSELATKKRSHELQEKAALLRHK